MATVQINQYQVRAGNIPLAPCGKHDNKMKEQLNRLFTDQSVQQEIARQWNVTDLTGLSFQFQIDAQGLNIRNTTNPAQNQTARIAMNALMTPVLLSAEKVGNKCAAHRCPQGPAPFQPAPQGNRIPTKSAQQAHIPAQPPLSLVEIAQSALTMANEMDTGGVNPLARLGRWSPQDRDELIRTYSTLKGINLNIGQQTFLNLNQPDLQRAEAFRILALKRMRHVLSQPSASIQTYQTIAQLKDLLPNPMRLAIQAKMTNRQVNMFDAVDLANAISSYLQEVYGNS